VKQKHVGYLVLVSPFVAVLAFCVADIGLWPTLACLCITAAIVAVLGLGASLVDSADPERVARPSRARRRIRRLRASTGT
jgi:hypothetical protein